MNTLKFNKGILIRTPNWLGDCIMALPMISGLAKQFPETRIDILARRPLADLGFLLPEVSNTYILRRWRTPATHSGELIDYRQYDTALILPNSFRTAFSLWKKDIRRTVGYTGDFRSLFLTDPVLRPPKNAMNQTNYFANLAVTAFPGLTTAPPVFDIPKDAHRRAEGFFWGIKGPVIGIGFGANYGSAKTWAPERFAKLIDRLSENAVVALFGAESDKRIERETVKLCHSSPLSLVGKTTIPELSAALSRLTLYISNDTGPMHIAAMVNTPVIALFGPTSARETAPSGDNVTVISHATDCAPCWQRTCPTDHRCMKSITVDEVYNKAMELQERYKKRANE